jgi:hypothetical protein
MIAREEAAQVAENGEDVSLCNIEFGAMTATDKENGD